MMIKVKLSSFSEKNHNYKNFVLIPPVLEILLFASTMDMDMDSSDTEQRHDDSGIELARIGDNEEVVNVTGDDTVEEAEEAPVEVRFLKM